MSRQKNKIIVLLVCIGILAAAGFVFAQPDLGLNEFGAQTNLGTKPLGQTIAEIVRVFLGVLGVIAIILLLYAGFLWMTAAGDATKIATAKKIMINAVIGLAIILSSFAITQFVIGALEKATGSNIGGGPGGPGGGGGLPADAFMVKGISPQGSIPIRNVVVRVALNHAPDAATINGNILVIKKSDNSLAPYNFNISNNTIEMVSSVSCPSPNESLKCFEGVTAYKVEVKTGLKDAGGKNIVCGFGSICAAEFTTGALVDALLPQVTVTYPDPGQSVPQNSLVDVWARATDDSAISHIEFFADGAYFDNDFAPASASSFDGKVLWDTVGAALGGHSLSARAYDVDSNNAFSAPVSVTVRAEHCFNGIKDADETGVDTGGADCAAGAGASCTQNSDCASGSCQNGVCVNTPIILNISPTDGAPGTFVTISGKYFGATAGTVTFLGGAGTADDKVAALAPCAGAWSENQVVVAAPQGIVSGPIEIKTSLGADATNDARGPALPNFIVNPILRPGICSLSPNEGKSGTSFTISGTEFGTSQGASFIKFGNTYALPQSWANTAISALVPVLSAGDNSVQIVRDNISSNALNFKVLSPTSGTKPTINYVSPDKGPAGEYITIFGSNLGGEAGVVQFVRSDGTVALGDANFPQVCAAVNYWRNSSVTVKVPDKFSDGSPTKNVTVSLRVRRYDNEISNVISFPINSDTPKPGICGINPDNGPVGTAVDIFGERFGVAGTATFYNNVGGAVTAWGGELVKTSVSNGAVSGPVKITSGGKDSNSVNFSVSDCSKTPGICSAEEQCCASSCIPKTSVCHAGAKEGAYGWKISTGIIPKVPRVVEDCSVGVDAANPSPSPWDSRPGGNSVCVNAIVNIRFNTKLDPATVIMTGVAADTIVLYKCTGAAPEPCTTKNKVPLNSIFSKIYSVGTAEDGVQLYPSAGKLDKDAQYLVELKTGIRGAGAGGGYMEERMECGIGLSYCFKFKTINSDGLCQVGSLVTSPQNFTSNKKELLEYISSPRAKNDVCLDINASVYSYTWSSSVPGKVSIKTVGFDLAGNPVQNKAIVETLSETDIDNPAIITSAIPAEGVSGKASLVVDFSDPEVASKWPSCNSACVNALIGAAFNTDMDASTLIPANIETLKCKTENCDSFDGTPIAGSINYDAAGKKFNFTPAAPLEISRYYQVRLNTLKIKSSSGVNLIGANNLNYYTWQFKTRPDATPCTINKVNLNPSFQIFDYIGQIAEFESDAMGAPDNCSPIGQLLNPFTYNWSWVAANAGVAGLLNNGAYNVLPPSGIGCNNKCLHAGSGSNVSVCGNSIKEKGEDCDDGNTKSGDKCSGNCLDEGSITTCGNSIKDAGEDCDDGNKKSGDGCSDICLNEGSSAGGSRCGNGDLGKGEDCDDENSWSGDGCSGQCLNEGSDSGIASCGNNKIEKNLGEDCDDGNIISGDGCSANCLNEGSIVAETTCGNGGLPEKGEDCDDGNTKSGDGCSSVCLNEGSNLNYKPAGSICGNNSVEKGEDCDAVAKDSNVDPRQHVSAEGKGITQISAAANGITGKSNVEVMCVAVKDSDCPAGYGAGADNCCWEKAAVISNIPAIGQTNVCRNTLISATYNKLMDGVAGEISIDQKKNGNCLAGTASADGLWCLGAIKATRQIFDDVVNKWTAFDWNISNALLTNTIYRVELKNFKNKAGVTAVDYSWQFTTGADICKIEKVEIQENPIIFYNTKLADSANPNGSPRNVLARALTKEGAAIVSIPGIYAWDWNWSPAASLANSITLGDTKINPTAITAKPANGDGTLTARAEITADNFSISAKKSISGTAQVIVFLCENPWPGLTAFPWQIDTIAYASTYYCRDNKPEPLPALNNVSVGASGDILKEFLLADPFTGDAVGIRIYQNPNHLSPLAWYKSKLFAGTPSAAKVDGYEAIVDGRTTYVNAGNVSGNSNYTNIFVISYNQGAAAGIQNIYSQILKNWKFNTNLTNPEQCQIDGKPCSSDLDCQAGVCQADKNKIIRDVKRLADFGDISELLENYKTANNAYPSLIAGSFLRGRSVSVWPSWQAALGNDLGRALAVDPINKHNACAAPYNSTTCWDGGDGKYICPTGSRVYNYRYLAQNSYQLGGDLEYQQGAGWSGINSKFIIQGFCSAVQEGASEKCGDGVVGTGEQCEKGNVSMESCTMPTGKSGNRNLTCNISCQWDRTAVCQAGQCGDGVKQGPEVCDDGQNNGRYGYCDTACGGLAYNCGDGKLNGYEQCDLSAANGQYNADYNASCSWDCKKPGPSCGDKLVQTGNGEQCDGNFETKKDVAGLPLCGKDANGYDTFRTKTCANNCQWNAWGSCLAAGSCGNGAKEGTEQCDDGNPTNTDNCIIDQLKNIMCKAAVCGDGYVQAGKEACDVGVNNNKECSPAYGRTCDYCGASCAIITKTGDYCGDGKKNGPEECDGSQFGGTTCKTYGFIEFTGENNLTCAPDCKADVSKCTSVFRANAGGPTWTDPDGNTWVADTIYNNALYTGSNGTWSSVVPIGGTELDTLYQTERFSNSNLAYNFNIGPGQYRVRLHFAEIFLVSTNADVRVFNIKAETKPYEYNLDLPKSAGLNTALVKEYTIEVTDSALNISLEKSGGVNGPKLSAIEIESGGGAVSQGVPPPCTNQCNATGEKGCDGAYVTTCAKVGECFVWLKASFACQGGGCSNGTCVSTPPPPPPPPSCTSNCTVSGDTRCYSASQRETCGSVSGGCLQWKDRITCGISCSGKTCTKPACLDGTKQACSYSYGTCVRNGTQTCAGGVWGACTYITSEDPRIATCNTAAACASDGCGGMCSTLSKCPSPPQCNRYICSSFACLLIPANEGGKCTSGMLTLTCRSGKCTF